MPPVRSFHKRDTPIKRELVRVLTSFDPENTTQIPLRELKELINKNMGREISIHDHIYNLSREKYISVVELKSEDNIPSKRIQKAIRLTPTQQKRLSKILIEWKNREVATKRNTPTENRVARKTSRHISR